MPSDQDQRPPASHGPAADPYGIQFEVVASIADGSSARVDLCRCLTASAAGARAGQMIAVKRPNSDMIGEDHVSRRFLDEVWMSASLRHPNVVSVIGWGRDAQGPYLALELVAGVSLARLLKSVFDTGEQFSERLVVYLAQMIGAGLSAAHELRSDRGDFLQLVHRDLSAANVLVSFTGEVKIADFGLAKAKDRLTVTTSELPTRNMGHVSPEELTQGPVDHRSDLFSFGTLMFELLTGKPAFSGSDELATVQAVLQRPPPDLDILRPKLDRGLSALVVQCLEKDPNRRPSSAREIERFMAKWLDLHGYRTDSDGVLSRFVRRNSMRQMRWFERVLAGEPEPAPLPFNAPKPSFYDLGNPRKTSSGATNTRDRDNERTAVERGSRGPPPRRSASTETLALVAPRLLENPSSDGETPMFVEGETDEDIPTLALRVDPAIRQQLPPHHRPQRPVPDRRGPLNTAFMHDPAVEPPNAQRTMRRIEKELANLRLAAGQRHDGARAAREAARLAVLEAERTEAEARGVERAIAQLRQALDLAARGSVEEANRRVDDALAALPGTPGSPPRQGA